MSLADDRKRRNKEQPSKSNQEGWRQDGLEKLKREFEEKKHEEEAIKLKMESLKQEISEAEEKSRPAQDRQQEIASADEKVSTSGSDEFTDKTIKREEEHQSAQKQAPEKEGEDVG